MKKAKKIVAVALAAASMSLAFADAAVLQKAQRQIIQPRTVRFTISVSVSLFSMRLLTPQQKALKIILLRNSVQTM